MRSEHPVARRFILVLAILQVMVGIFGPLHDVGLSADRGPVRVERQHTHPFAPIHDPDSCALCQLLSAQVVRPEMTRVGVVLQRIQRPQSLALVIPAARPPPAAHQTRAPPLPLA